MKKMIGIFATSAAALLVVIANLLASAPCIGLCNEPEMPAELKK
jgi:cyclic lactone autoinducer peptide